VPGWRPFHREPQVVGVAKSSVDLFLRVLGMHGTSYGKPSCFHLSTVTYVVCLQLSTQQVTGHCCVRRVQVVYGRLPPVPARRRLRTPSPARSAFAGFRFPPEVIVLAVRWYLRFGLSYRDVEELLAERGVEIDHVTIYRWVRQFTPLLAEAARPCRHAVGNRRFVDETHLKVAGRWRCTYRAVDQFGQVVCHER
jgi:hypothetical protein